MTMSILDPTGHSEIKWDAENEDEVEVAKEHFKKLKKKNYLSFKADKKGEQGEQITEFNKKHEHIIMVPQLRGG